MNYICMNTQFYPKNTPESEHQYFDVMIFREGQYPLKKITDMFFAQFLARMKTIERQATYVAIHADEVFNGEDGPEPFIARIVALFTGRDKVEACLYTLSDDGDFEPDLVNVLIDGIPEYRSLDTLVCPGKWDCISHGEVYPSDRTEYDSRLTKFFEGKYVHENPDSETRL